MFAVMANPAILKHVGRKCSDVEVNGKQHEIHFRVFFRFKLILLYLYIIGEICTRQINV